MKNKLLLINPNFVRKINGQTPLNLAYLATAVEKYAEVEIIDLNVEPEESLDKLLIEFNPTHIGISRYTPNSIDSLNLLKRIHEQYPEIITITGGPHEIYRGDITKKLNPWIDHVVREKNAEQSLLRIITGDENKAVDWKILFPSYNLLNMNEESYRFDSNIFPNKKMLQYMTARGCNHHCTFCPSGNYNAMDNEVVIEHLKKIIDMGYEAIFFNDVNFVANPKRTKELMELIIEEGLNKKLEWGCQTTADESLNDELIQLMAKAGCNYITYSLENACSEALKKINKRLNPNIVAHKCNTAKESRMQVGLYIMFGILDNEKTDFHCVQKTLDKVAEINPDYVSYAILSD